jgi:FixJ family two-component response regulator
MKAEWLVSRRPLCTKERTGARPAVDDEAERESLAVMTEGNSYIAIVDDDPSVRKALARLISSFSFRAQSYATVREFLQSLKAGVPNCLILDLQMDEVTGLELQNHLQNTGVRIPTIVLTAHDEPGMQDRCTAAGAVAFLVKPVSKEQLFEAIRGATGGGA